MNINIPDDVLRGEAKEIPVELLRQLRLVELTRRSDYLAGSSRSVKTLEVLLGEDGKKYGIVVTEGRYGETLNDIIHHTGAEFFFYMEPAIVSFYADTYKTQKP